MKVLLRVVMGVDSTQCLFYSLLIELTVKNGVYIV